MSLTKTIETIAWQTHRHPAGFSLVKPVAWSVRSAGPGDIVVSHPLGSAAAMVRARVVPPGQTLADWVRQSYPATEPGLHNVRTLKVESHDPRIASAVFDYGSTVFEGRASLVAVRQNDVATVFVAAAARADFATRLPELARMLDSVRFVASGDDRPQARQRSTDELRYTRWTDPAEGAFAAELPAGWPVAGGLRRSTWNVRLAFAATSPDGTAQLFFGDVSLPRMFIEPNATTRSLGHREGLDGGSDAMTILAFQSADRLGAELVRRRFGAQVTGTRSRPDLVEITRRNPLLQGGGTTAASAADVDFRLADGRIGVLTLTTFGKAVGQVGASWWVDGVHGFVAPVDRTAQTASALLRLLITLRENPPWAAGERDHQQRMGRQFQAYLEWSRRLQQQSIEQRWLAHEARQRGLRDVLGGMVRLRDPSTGETFEATANDRYYFRVKDASRPHAVGSDVDFKPLTDLALVRLLQIGVDLPDR